MEKKNLPALDNETLRKLNTQKVVDSFESIGDLAKIAKYNTKIGIISGLIILFLLIFIVGGAYLYVALNTNGDFLDSIFGLDEVSQRYVCYNGLFEDNATFKNPSGANNFKILFNNSKCIYYSTKK